MPALSLQSTLVVFALQWLIFSGAGIAAQIWRRRLTGRGSTALEAVLLGALVPCALGYLAVGAYLLHPLAGRIFSWVAIIVILDTVVKGYLLHGFRRRPLTGIAQERPAVHGRLMLLTLFAGLFYISVLAVFPQSNFSETAADRFLTGLSPRNEVPRVLAEELYIGEAAPAAVRLNREVAPLQSGLALVTLPALRTLGLGVDASCSTAGVWFQLLWIPALWVFLRWLGLTERQAHGATAALVFTGYLLLNSVFVWPQLASAALVLLAFCTFLATEQAIEPRYRWIAGGALAAFGWLALAVAWMPLLAVAAFAFSAHRGQWRSWRLALATFAGLVLPWFAYQRLAGPPSSHVALAADFGALSRSSEAAANRGSLLTEVKNILTTANREVIGERRVDEVTRESRTPATWILGLAALPFLVWQGLRRRPAWLGHVRRHKLAVAWLIASLGLWLLLREEADTFARNGLAVVALVLVGLLATWTLLVSRTAFVALAVVQLALFTLTWMPPSALVDEMVPRPFAIAAAGVTALLIVALGVEALFWPEPAREAAGALSLRARLREWFRAPRLNPWVFALFAVLLFLRKPYALLVPQLYAEDGTIFLVQSDLVGLQAFIEGYMGYLHTLPRLIAWITSKTLDPAWWPACYNGVSYLIWLAVIARTFSPRLPLPNALRPFLALTFFLGPQTGEVLSCITNLQWLTGFLIIEQAIIARPTNARQRIGDIALIALVGLTGPFIIALGPLLAWRWWRDRNADTFAILATATLCAGVQAWYIVRTGPKFEFPPFVASKFFEVIGQHLVVWPLVGDNLAKQMSPVLIGVIGMGLCFASVAWALRPHARQLLRAQLVAGFLLMMVAGVYRSRPDTWSLDNLVFGDRYFYLPRLMLAWLLVLELDATQRAIAWFARVLALACVLAHIKTFSVPAEYDYRWTEHVDAIRKGVRGNMVTLPEGWMLEYQGRKK